MRDDPQEVTPAPTPAIGGEILARAEGVDAELAGAAAAPGSPATAAAPPPIALELELAGMFELVGVGAGQFLPTVGATLDEAACKKLGEALAPVFRKYGLERYFAGFAWRVELQALMVCGPIVAAVIAAARADIAIAKAKMRGEIPAQASSLAASSPSSAPAAAAAPAAPYEPPPGALKPLTPEELEAAAAAARAIA